MKLALRARSVYKKVTLVTTAFVLAVSSLTASVPFILSKSAHADTNTVTVADLATAVASASDGDVINVTGTGTITNKITITKDITLNGAGATIETSGNANVFGVNAAGVTIEGFNFVKTDNSDQNLIQVLANNATISDNTFSGQFTLAAGTGTTRAFEVTGSLSGLSINHNTIHNLRQPAYINNQTSGSITNNYIDQTKGWVVVSDTNLTFSGNTFGTNAIGIAFISQNASANNYTCDVMAQIKSANAGVTIDNQVATTTCVGAPTNLLPANGSATNNPDFTMSWNAVDGATKYQYRTSHSLIDANTLGTIAYEDDSSSSNYTIGSTTITRGNHGTPEGTWYWQVQAGDSKGWGPWSAISAVTTDYSVPSVPVHVSPSNNALINTNDFYFDWNDVEGATHYEIQNSTNPAVDANGSFQNVMWTGDYQHIQPTDSQAHSVGASGTWYWQVRSIDAAGNVSAWSQPWGVTIDTTAPSVTLKTSPDTIGSGPYQKVSYKLFDANKVDKAEINGHLIDLSNNEWSDLNNIAVGSMFGVLGTNTLKVWDVAGNVTTQTFVLDNVAPTATFAYSNNNGAAVTNQDVTVTMTTSEPIQTPSGWTPVDATHFTKVYSNNAKDSVTISDFATNTSVQNYEVKRIDKVAPVITGVTNGQTTRGTVMFNVNDQNFNKLYINGTQVATNHPGGWDYTPVNALSGDGTYIISATDKGGNETDVTVTIDNTLTATFDPIDEDTLTPALTGAVAYTADGTPLANSDVVVNVDGTDYPTTTDADGKWVAGVAVANGPHTVTLSRVNSDASQTPANGTASFTTAVTPTDTQTGTDGGTPTGDGSTQQNTPNTNTPTPVAFPAAVNPGAFAQVLGDSTTNTNNGNTPNGSSDVKGTSTDNNKNLASAIGTTSDGTVFGMAWYWWLLILAAIATIIWWIIAAIRNRAAANS